MSGKPRQHENTSRPMSFSLDMKVTDLTDMEKLDFNMKKHLERITGVSVMYIEKTSG